jgi:hypothetical protein
MLGGDSSVESGMLEPQTSTSAPSGTFAFGAIDPEDANANADAGVATFSGGDVSGVDDDARDIGQIFGPQNVTAGTGTGSNGLFGISQNTSACTIGGTGAGGCELIIYEIGANRFVLISVLNNSGTAQTDTALDIADQ